MYILNPSLYKHLSPHAAVPLELQCDKELIGGLLVVDCEANKPLNMTVCSVDGAPEEPCKKDYVIYIF